MKPHHTFAVIVLILALFILSQSVFTVDQTEQALVLQLGQPKGDIQEPGLHFKLPLIQDVVYFDRRILSADLNLPQVVISSIRDTAAAKDNTPAAISAISPAIPEAPLSVEDALASGEPISVDIFARYHIVDPLKFLKTLRTTEAANDRLESILNDATRGVLGKTTLRQLLSPERNAVMTEILDLVNKRVHDDQLGIDINDIRIVRADLTPQLL